MTKVLICGDSFAADWTVKYPNEGWPNLLAKKYDVTNLAQAGCCEYKIYKQLLSVDLSKFDHIIVFHTSPNRLYTNKHPIHHKDILHSNSDLIYNDIKQHSKSNKELLPIVEYFEQHFDVDYAIFSHNLLCKHIDEMLNSYNTIHATGIDYTGLYKFDEMLNFSKQAMPDKGYTNHFDSNGNKFVYETIVAILKF